VPSTAALADIPGNYLHWIRQGAARYGLDWTVIAAIYSIESDFGRLTAPGVQSGENSAGAGGPGQFLTATWARYGVDGDGDGRIDRYDPVDAIPTTANLLRHNGAPADYPRAVFAYTHAGWYVADVLARATRYRGATDATPDGVQIAVAGVAPAPGCAEAAGASGPADLNTAGRLVSPAAYRALPTWAMAAGRASEPVDARLYADVL
jgi:membrane-bound lytic murein transglycosylase B